MAENTTISIDSGVALRELRLMHQEHVGRLENRIFVLAQQLETTATENAALKAEIDKLKTPPTESVN